MQVTWPKPNRSVGVLDGLALVGVLGFLVARFIPVAKLIPFWGCTFRNITGYPCPGCGLTRVADRFAHFNFYGAFKANPLGTGAALFFACAIVWSFLHLTLKLPTPTVVLDDREWKILRNVSIVVFLLNYLFVVVQHRAAIL